MLINEIRFKVNDITYKKVKGLSIKMGVPMTHIMRLAINFLIQFKEGKK